MIKQAANIPELAKQLKLGVPKPIEGAVVIGLDRKPRQFFTDGSLRSLMGARPNVSGRQLRKARKKLNRFIKKQGGIRPGGATITKVDE